LWVLDMTEEPTKLGRPERSPAVPATEKLELTLFQAVCRMAHLTRLGRNAYRRGPDEGCYRLVTYCFIGIHPSLDVLAFSLQRMSQRSWSVRMGRSDFQKVP
jgi:hypothetical protein